jgi:hypothetical protein
MPSRSLVVIGALLLAVPAFAAGTSAAEVLPRVDKSPAEVRPRVDHHLKQVEDLSQHFESVISQPCAHFASPGEWQAYFDGEVDRVVLLWAHVEQAWIEAKQTGDDEVRRAAKAPRKHLEDARALLDKLQTCAADNGASFSQGTVWRKIEREVPRRQAQIALPQPDAAATPRQ